jgi:hypothetical protein
MVKTGIAAKSLILQIITGFIHPLMDNQGLLQLQVITQISTTVNPFNYAGKILYSVKLHKKNLITETPETTFIIKLTRMRRPTD